MRFKDMGGNQGLEWVDSSDACISKAISATCQKTVINGARATAGFISLVGLEQPLAIMESPAETGPSEG